MRRVLTPLVLLATLAFAAPAGAAVVFGSPTNYPVGTGPLAITAGDFDSGAGVDLAVATQTGARFDTLMNNGSGSFAAGPGSPYALGGTGRTMATGDLNGDGLDDLVVGTGNNGKAFLASPSGQFTAVSPNFTSTAVVAIGTGFFDAGPNLDVVTTQTVGGVERVSVFLGDGAGGFTPGPTVDIGNDPSNKLVVDDFTGDGADDVAVGNFNNSTLTVLLNNGAGTLAQSAQSPISLPGSPSRLATGDLNGDGRPDIATPQFNGSASAGVRILLADGAGTFASPVDLPQSLTGTKNTAVGISDFDGDGNLDLAASSEVSPGTVHVLIGGGNGTTFTAGPTLTTGNEAEALTAQDLNNDGNSDLATANLSSNNVSVFLAQPPTVSVSPGSLGFGNQNVGSTSGTQTVTLTNNGPQTIGPIASITGPNARDFERVDDRCSPANVFLGPGASCTVGVRFRPDSAGDKGATLAIASNAAGSPAKVPLSGTGVQPSSNTPVVPIVDRTPPTQTISIRRQTVRAVIRDGLILFASCSEPCAFRAEARVKSSTRRKKRRRGRAARLVTAGAANAALATTRRRVVIKIRKSARRALRRTRKISLVTTATDTVGNTSRVTRGVKLRRR